MLEMGISPTDLFCAISEHCDNVFLLESSGIYGKLARYSFVGFSPSKHITLTDKVLSINGEQRDSIKPLEELRKEIPQRSASQSGFVGGAVGYFSFDYFRQLEKFENNLVDETGFPDFEFGVFDDVIMFDHYDNSINYIHFGLDRFDEILKFVKDASFETQSLTMFNKRPSAKKEEFCKSVETAKEFINSGDIFQAVLSKRYEVKFSGNLLQFYKKLKAINPSPYMYYLKFGERQVIGASPENLIRVEDKKIESYATLAGTRPRGKTQAEDALLERELLADEKERAEHLMLVDLTRNDIGKVARAGSVNVSELLSVHKFSHVQHLASIITAELAENKTSFDAFNAIFPAGTVSGAPKIRAIEIIDELEKTKRGPYGGAVGYFSSNGNLDFAICIRTLFANKNRAFVQAGAGIVFDSVAEKEFDEAENKARVLLDALGDGRYEAAINR